MRWLLLAVVTLTALAGCVETGSDGEDFQVTCPNWWPAPDNAQAVHEFIHNATSSNEDFRKEDKHSKWVVHPGTPGGYTYSYTDENGTESALNGGVLDFYEIQVRTGREFNGTFVPFGPIDSRMIIEAHRAPRDENPRTPEGEETDDPTGEVLRFESMSTGETTHQIVIDEGDVINESYRLRLTDGSGPVDPASLRVDVYWFGNQDDDGTTDSYAAISMESERWYRHKDCV